MSFSNSSEWASYLLRWIHLIAGISWIGNSFYFMWLDSHLTRPEPPREGVESELWMVHSGGFYRVERRRIEQATFPKILHWFKWEATLTWVSGFFLLGWIYYLNAELYLVNNGYFNLSSGSAIAASLIFLIAGWFVYDGIWRIGSVNRSRWGGVILSAALVCFLVYALNFVFPGRAAYIHLGAIFGTIMVLNVWVHILPAQQQMIQATKENRIPDYELGKKAKKRSTHNSYLTFPVLFVMLSNHYSMTFGSPHRTVILLLLIALGMLIRHWMLSREKKPLWVVLPILICIGGLLYLSDRKIESSQILRKVGFNEIHTIMKNRCVTCHSTHPTDALFPAAPNGVTFDDPESISKFAQKIQDRVVNDKTMPLANRTQMTDLERETVALWIKQGASRED